MKTHKITLRLTMVAAILLLTAFLYNSSVFSQGNDQADKTESPYFKVISDEAVDITMPLKSTKADISIAGVIADVQITQTYENTGNIPIEAIYVFPASTRAAVYFMEMKIGERTITAKIEEKQKARDDYEAAREQGQSASLLEQHRPNVFQMNVANIMPGDVIIVSLNYTELLVPIEGTYEFSYPAVVGPRYSNQPDDLLASNSDELWVSNPYSEEGKLPDYEFHIDASINAGMPISEISCKSHDVDINYLDETHVQIDLPDSEKHRGNKDFILQYRLKGKQIETGLLLYEGKEENFFLAMIQPPKAIKISEIPPREYIFIVDVSGSMYGFPLDVTKKLMKDLLSNLQPKDKFNILLFAGNSEIMSANGSVNATEKNIKEAISFINRQSGAGGTELLPALKRALNLKPAGDYSRTFIIATDGYVTVDKEAFDLIRNNLSKANFFPFGIGSSVNRHLIEGMAHIGKGEPFIVTSTQEAGKVAKKLKQYIQYPVLTNINAKFNGFEAYDIEPLSMPDVLAERPILLYGKYKGIASGTIKITGSNGNGKFHRELNVTRANKHNDNSAIKYLWARERIKLLQDYNIVAYNDEKIAEEVTALGLKYNLLTEYTSFIAIDSEIRNESGQQTTVNQVLPLPEGVSNYAVGSVSTSSMGAGYPRSRSKKSLLYNKAVETTSYDALQIADCEEELSIKEEPINIVEPEFTGKNGEDLKSFINNNLKYPEESYKNSVEGIVLLKIIIDENGFIDKIVIIKNATPELDAEALRILRLTKGMWVAARNNGFTVKSEKMVTVKFEIQ